MAGPDWFIKDDSEILDGFFMRNEDALRWMKDKYQQKLFAAGQGILAKREDIEECIQDTYLSAWNAIPPKRPEHLLSFLVTILKNNAYGILRRDRAKKRIPPENQLSLEDIVDLSSDDDPIFTSLQEKELQWILSQYTERISEELKYVLIGHFLFDKSVRKIASELNVTKHRVERDIETLRKDIRALLEKEGYVI